MISFSFLGYALRLAAPEALPLLGVAALVAAAGAVALVRRRRALAAAAGDLGPRLAPGAGALRPAARLGMETLGLALLALALSRPQCGARVEVARRTGVDLAVVLDASRSMRVRDVKPDRMDRARLEVSALLDGLAGDRVALVAFAGEPFVQCPLTSDLAAARLFLRAVDPEAMPRQGTALADALLAAQGTLEAAAAGPRAKVVLVVSDGEDHDGGAPAAARTLAEAGVRTYALAVGTRLGGPVPVPEPGRPERSLADRAGAPVISRADPSSLRAVTEAGGGELYELGSAGGGLAPFKAALERLQRGDVEARVETAWEERYALAAFPGFLLLLAALLLREAPRRRPA